MKLIHITTDCVFTGLTGFYTETSTHDSLDIYGKTKSLGEPEKATVIRTSIIGEELYNKKSLLEWVKTNKNNRIEKQKYFKLPKTNSYMEYITKAQS